MQINVAKNVVAEADICTFQNNDVRGKKYPYGGLMYLYPGAFFTGSNS